MLYRKSYESGTKLNCVPCFSSSKMQFKQDTALSDTSPQGPDWLGLNLQAANLRNADLRNADLDNANLEGADLRAANLQKANLQNANLRRANLEGADLKDARLDNAEVRDCNFNDSDLRDANLATVRGLDAQQLAGANLAGVGLPKEISDFSGLSFVNELSKDTQALFAVLLLACIYSWLTIASTQDVQLFTSTGSSELPIIRTTVPLLFVYGAGPILFIDHFHLFSYLYAAPLGSHVKFTCRVSRRWRTASEDQSLDSERVCFSSIASQSTKSSPLSRSQLAIGIVAAWWLVPVTNLFFWLRYVHRQRLALSISHSIVLAASVFAALYFQELAAKTLRHRRTSTAVNAVQMEPVR